MAYGDRDAAAESDDFSAAFGSGWTNNPDLWTGCTRQAPGGGTVIPSTTATACRVTRNTGAVGDDHYSRVEVNRWVNTGNVGCSIRGTSTTTACYIGYCRNTGTTDAYNIIDIAENGSTSTVANTTMTNTLAAGNFVTLECVGDTLRLGENSTGTDTEYLSGTDSTWTSGEAGVYLEHDATADDARITSWDTGNMTAAGAGLPAGGLSLLGVGV